MENVVETSGVEEIKAQNREYCENASFEEWSAWKEADDCD